MWNLARYTNGSIYDTALSLLQDRHHRVIDVGCGSGVMSAKLAATGRDVVGVDLSEGMIAQAQRRKADNCTFLRGDAENLPVADQSFDAVVNLISFHHYPNPQNAAAEFRRVLRSSGRLVLVAFDRHSLYIRMAQRLNPWIKALAGTSFQKTAREIVAILGAAGFANIQVKSVPYWIKTFAVTAEPE